ncbi:hypothetical protein JCM8202v2_002587 [Rhodotorula sphaerocarpa]
MTAPAPATHENLPVCKKTVLFRFGRLHGFGSELTLLYRVAAVARHYGYEVFLEDSKWNHGTWSNYFEPLSLLAADFDGSKGDHRTSPRCRLPRPGTKRSKLVLTADEIRTLSLPPSQASSDDALPFVPRWTARPHVLWSSRDMDGLDLTFLRLFTSPVDLEALHRSSIDQREAEKVFLSPAETMPEPLERAFETLSRVAGQAWKVVPEIEASIRVMEDRILPVEQVPAGRARRAGDLLIAVHVRLGDKFLELHGIKTAAGEADRVATSSDEAPPGLTPELVSAYLSAAIDSVQSLLNLPRPSSPPPSSYGDSSNAAEPGWAADPDSDAGQPLLVLMSDDSGAVEAFRQHALARYFRIRATTEIASTAGGEAEAELAGREPVAVDVSEGTEERGRQRSLAARSGAGASGRRRNHAQIPPGFNETQFNRLPLPARIASTRAFVRDLTFLARNADALVVTGSSNVGRMLMVLHEAEARRRRGENGGAREGEEGKAEGGGRRREMRSLDTRWFPTARYV